MTIPHEPIPPRFAKINQSEKKLPAKETKRINQVDADDYDDYDNLNLDFAHRPTAQAPIQQVVETATPVTQVAEVAPTTGKLNFDDEKFDGPGYDSFNQTSNHTSEEAEIIKNHIAKMFGKSRFANIKIDDPWTTEPVFVPESPLRSKIFPGAKAASPIINDPLAGRNPWLREESAPPIPTGYQPIPVQLHIPEFENFDQSYRNVITAPGQVPTTSPHYVEQTVLPLETGNEQLQLPLYSQPTDAANDRIPYEAFKKPQYGLFDGAWKGLKSGFNYAIDGESDRSRSAIFHRAPSYEWDYLPEQGRAAYGIGRVAGDIVGYGTRQSIWRSQPPDISGTYSGKGLKAAGGSRLATIVGPFAVTSAMDFGSNIYNPLNLMQGGRPAGYQANSPDPDDPRESTAPVYDLAVEKGLFGRRGRLLPWEQFKQERPDISYDQYKNYQDYLYNKDDNLLSKATLGIVKGDMDGINGPEISIAGYGVTPLGVAAALGTYGAIRHGIGRVGVLTR